MENKPNCDRCEELVGSTYPATHSVRDVKGGEIIGYACTDCSSYYRVTKRKHVEFIGQPVFSTHFKRRSR